MNLTPRTDFILFQYDLLILLQIGFLILICCLQVSELLFQRPYLAFIARQDPLGIGDFTLKPAYNILGFR